MKTKTQNGFTLIELIIVISILGILAAFAIPKFIAIETNARASVIQAVGGSVRSASELAHAQWVADGSDDNAEATVKMGDQTINIVHGYPSTAAIELTIKNPIDGVGFAAGVFSSTDATTPSTCAVTYVQAAANSAPSITVVTEGC